MGLTLQNMIVQCVKQRPNEDLSADTIADMIVKQFPNEAEEKRNNSKNPHIQSGKIAIEEQYVREIPGKRFRIIKNNPDIIIKKIGKKIAYYYNASGEIFSEEQEEKQVQTANVNKKEVDIYPLLREFLLTELNVYSIRINESKGRNKKKGTNKWLYPDIVGLENLSEKWSDDVKNICGEFSGKKVQLWSFEVKNMLNQSNVREYFFQAVSNSSWANFSYLVTTQMDDEEETMKELRMLSSLHGVGVMLLDPDNHMNDSGILITARERVDADWESIDRLADASKEFKKYIKDAKNTSMTGENPKDWKIPQSED